MRREAVLKAIRWPSATTATAGPFAARRRSKYGAKPLVVDGIRFASKREGRRYQALWLLAQAGEITDLKRQVRFVLHAHGGGQVGLYIADFVYRDQTGAQVVEDAKGFETDLYNWKRRHMSAEYHIEIREV